MNYLLDIAAVMIIVAAISINAKRGFVRCLLYVISFVAALLLATQLSAAFADKVYDRFLSERVYEEVNEKLPETDIIGFVNERIVVKAAGKELDEQKLREAVLAKGDMAQNIALALNDELGAEVDAEAIEKALSADNLINSNENLSEDEKKLLMTVADASSQNLYSLIRILADDSRENVAEQISQKLIRPLGVRMVGFVLGLAVFMLANAVFRFFASKFDLVDKIPVAGRLNTILGGVTGAIVGLVIVAAAVFALSLLTAFLPDIAWFSSENIDKTVVIKFFYRLIT